MTVYNPETVDKVLQWIKDGEAWLNHGRELLSQALVDPPQQDLRWGQITIDWRLKGGAPAGATDDWAWVHVYGMDRRIKPELQQLVDYLKRYGKAQQQGYEITLSKNGEFLNRHRLRQA